MNTAHQRAEIQLGPMSNFKQKVNAMTRITEQIEKVSMSSSTLTEIGFNTYY